MVWVSQFALLSGSAWQVSSSEEEVKRSRLIATDKLLLLQGGIAFSSSSFIIDLIAPHLAEFQHLLQPDRVLTPWCFVFSKVALICGMLSFGD